RGGPFGERPRDRHRGCPRARSAPRRREAAVPQAPPRSPRTKARERDRGNSDPPPGVHSVGAVPGRAEADGRRRQRIARKTRTDIGPGRGRPPPREGGGKELRPDAPADPRGPRRGDPGREPPTEPLVRRVPPVARGPG